ncbi:halovibrin HvnA [Pseudomonas frederiksbergensis]|jgi:hypothetical protein|uniref:Halovibrin HvnA n=1 Tax=Pseudomonas frederiksbergensis TaxID=104087 RepID=A0A423J730_9PSED|nr:halovibrin HvnA [Pseudomonas frederiksbergensis]RON33397.1 halovibrin HvnA [Pseudomonas frederiksbergensis]
MKKIIALMLMVVLAGCQVRDQQLQSATTSSIAQSGPEIAADLTARYNDVRINCGSPSTPAFLCSGIILRSTVHGPGYFFWNPSPHSQQSGGVSFSYLRKDAKFQKLVFGQNNGFVFYPVFNTPPGKEHIEILCSYPIDGWTQLRETPGCGAHPYYPTQSKRCQTMGISTAEQWMAHWNAAPSSAYRPAYQCSFDVRDSMNQLAADSFYQSLRTRNLLGATWFPQQNELILRTWAQTDNPNGLPIQALFYTGDGLSNARKDQVHFRNQSGDVLPIIKLTLPTNSSENAVFTYDPNDLDPSIP